MNCTINKVLYILNFCQNVLTDYDPGGVGGWIIQYIVELQSLHSVTGQSTKSSASLSTHGKLDSALRLHKH